MAPDDLEREKHVFHAHYHVTEAPLSHRKSETAEKKSNRCRNAGVVRSQNEPYPNDWAHSPKYMVYNLIYETKPVLSDLAYTIRNGCSCLFVFFVCSCQNVIDTRNVWAYRALTSRTRENPNCFCFSSFFLSFCGLVLQEWRDIQCESHTKKKRNPCSLWNWFFRRFSSNKRHNTSTFDITIKRTHSLVYPYTRVKPPL